MGDLCGISDDDDRPAERSLFLNATIDWLFAQGHAADVILAVMLADLVWLTRRGRWTPVAAILRLAPGALMVVALRLSLTGGGWPWIALALGASLPFHLADLARGPGRRGGRP